MKRIAFLLIISLLAGTCTGSAAAFDKSLADATQGTLHPHILKTERYDLNTRNVKALTRAGRYLWIGTSMGAIRYDTATNEDYDVVDNQSGLLSNGIFSIKIDPQGRPWIGTYGGGLSYRDGGRWINLNTPSGLLDAFVYDVEFHEDALWVATWSGANRIAGDPSDRSHWQGFTVENTGGGLIDNWVYGIERDSNGRVWFGTESGVSMWDGRSWRSFNHKDGLGAPIERVRGDNVGAVSPFEGGHHAGHQADAPNLESMDYRPNYVVSFLMDAQDRLWIGTWGGGLSVLDTRDFKFRNFTARDGLPGNFILALKEGPDGELWIGSNGGLSRFDGRRFENFARINGLSGGFVFSLEFGAGHSLWLGGHEGIDRLTLDPATGEPLRLDASGGPN